MFLALIVYNIIFIPLVFGHNTSTPNDHSLALSLLTKVQEVTTKTNVTIVSEGEPVAQSAPLEQKTISPKDHHAILMSLDKELSKDKITAPSDSRVKPRKGVEYNVDSDTDTEDKSHLKQQQLVHLDDIKLINKSSSEMEAKNTTLTTLKLLNNTLPEQKVNKTVHKKPKVLSNEALDKIVFPSDLKLSGISSSTKTVTTNQIPSPEGPNKRIQSVSGYSHPGMVMPVVITILVVPMFAVLGYMALKRGKEAWKNRHYKRMDFLLDGMYNE